MSVLLKAPVKKDLFLLEYKKISQKQKQKSCDELQHSDYTNKIGREGNMQNQPVVYNKQLCQLADVLHHG